MPWTECVLEEGTVHDGEEEGASLGIDDGVGTIVADEQGGVCSVDPTKEVGDARFCLPSVGR